MFGRLHEEKATSFMKSMLPRHTRINLKPTGYTDEMLIARVITLNGQKDVAEMISSEGLAKIRC